MSERELKLVVLNRKNSPFGGKERGRAAAILACTCRRHEVDPLVYLTQLLVNLPSVRMSELAKCLPEEWKRCQAERAARLGV